VLIVEDIDTLNVTRTRADRRRSHPIFSPFWDMGAELIEGRSTDSVPDVRPYQSAQRDITIAAAQIACSREISDNVRKIREHIRKAADSGADIVVFPELAVTDREAQAVRAAGRTDLDAALRSIRRQADLANVYAIVGMPYFAGNQRHNCAFVIADDGSIKTRYAQIAAGRDDLFKPGLKAGAMWFDLKGVQSIVTIGDDADWIEIADLAAARGMYMHFHITSEVYPSADAVVMGRQRNLLMLMYAKYGAVVNAASGPESPSGGISMIVSREGGHNRPAPTGVEYYLPYQTSVVRSAGSAETMIVATRRTQRSNDTDLGRYWRNRNRRRRPQSGWYDWMKLGALLIRGEGH
jgi:predicted amidohydrolase